MAGDGLRFLCRPENVRIRKIGNYNYSRYYYYYDRGIIKKNIIVVPWERPRPVMGVGHGVQHTMQCRGGSSFIPIARNDAMIYFIYIYI